MEYILITNKPDIAKYAQDCGVHRIMIDLEIKGKLERQGHLDTVVSNHSLDDIDRIRKVLDYSKLLVRINPIYEDSESEIKRVISSGADIIMLPMFTSSFEVKTFISYIKANVKTILLLETPPALVRVDEFILLPGIDEIHIGLNDLHLGMNLTFMFELLSGGLVEYLANKFNSAGIRFGFGGIARLGKGTIDSSLILSEHYRLNSKMVILSRDFSGGNLSFNEFKSRFDLKTEIQKINDYYKKLQNLSQDELLKNKKLLVKLIREHVALK